MLEYQENFIKVAIENDVLKFGSFKLKSGRISPFFLNAGNFNTGKALLNVGEFYSEAIVRSGLDFDVLFGPAYKGIPLAAAVSSTLSRVVPIELQKTKYNNAGFPFAFDRKEKKDHGEGGMIIGSSLQGKKVLIIDDVITAGTAIRNSVDLIQKNGGIVVGVIVAIDRQEIGADSDLSAVEEIKKEFGFNVYSIVQLDSVIEFLKTTESEHKQFLPQITDYRNKYGVKL
ncbi:hypothetical protein BB559_003647 [Furculomyces boomerangus]|uniref:orotate phosphoribosyltransferase n=2 Tax=Harpellales TaxID=61421 RepID=A0A2T9YJY5_9FUNG|nr:hypothetical protein BB559_004455 [Furculomyces boomerangus]PVU92638.1 hypothetical protein BB559_003647 [Furculomyces boomerangus]PVZ99127.1 hypothetical protein BB558_004864 [Smittium angustum]